jgi:hypothetical protein
MNAKFGTNAKHNPYKEFNIWVNDLFFYYSGLTDIAVLINEKFGEEYGYFVGCYMRDLVAGTAVYWITGFMAEKLWEKWSVFINFENFTDTRQSKFDKVFTGTIQDPVFRDIYAPVDGFVINGGIKIRL